MAISFGLLLVEQIDMVGVVMLGVGVAIGISLALGGYYYLRVRRQPAGVASFGKPKLTVVCEVCNTRLSLDSQFCHECGTPIETEQAAEGHSPHSQYDRYLRRLDELRKTESIDDGVYLKLKKEFEEKRKRLGRVSGS